jgi:hypothetical protein
VRALRAKRREDFRSSVNTRVTKGKLRGRHFVEWAKDETAEAKSKKEERSTTWNQGDFVAPDAKAKSFVAELTVFSRLADPV